MERFPLRNSAVFLALSCIRKWGKTPVCPENLKLFIDLTFCEFLLMLDQRAPPSSDTPR
jgi:hypothetical protein